MVVTVSDGNRDIGRCFVLRLRRVVSTGSQQQKHSAKPDRQAAPQTSVILTVAISGASGVHATRFLRGPLIRAAFRHPRRRRMIAKRHCFNTRSASRPIRVGNCFRFQQRNRSVKIISYTPAVITAMEMGNLSVPADYQCNRRNRLGNHRFSHITMTSFHSLECVRPITGGKILPVSTM